MFIERTRIQFLLEWLHSEDRKPLIIRGARQVGKTWIIRQLAQQEQKQLIEVNFEMRPEMAKIFSSNDPRLIIRNLSAAMDVEIDPERCLLFLDEIQAAPEIIAKLRWFAENFPELPVVGAGSLLEFVLSDHSFSMPVGRIQYMHLEPLSFVEFLLAKGKNHLADYCSQFDFSVAIPDPIHENLTQILAEYMIIGGMPAAVKSWLKNNSLAKVNQHHHDLLATYRDDFPKYKGKLSTDRLEETMMTVPKNLAQKFVYSSVNSTATGESIKQALQLLNKARICYPVYSSAANGVPLAAEIRHKYFKEIFLDTGLASAALGLNLNQLQSVQAISLVNNGGIAEQLCGQLLRTISPPYIEPALYYWHRQQKGSNAEVDYVIQYQNQVIPIEVKAGRSGTLKSLHLFMGSKELALAVRVNSDVPSLTEVAVKDHSGQPINYQLLSIPFYLIEELPRLLGIVIKN